MIKYSIDDYSLFDNGSQYKSARVEHLILYFNEDQDNYYFYLEIENIKVSFIIAEKFIIDDKDCIVIKNISTIEMYRNRGYIKAIINTLYNQGFTIIFKNISEIDISIINAMSYLRRIIYKYNLENIMKTSYINILLGDTIIMKEQESNLSKFEIPITIYKDNNRLQEYKIFLENRYKNEIR